MSLHKKDLLLKYGQKDQSTKEVVKVIATYEFMRGAEEIKYKNKGES